MKLDRTHIAISERSHVDILDLSFLLLRELFLPIAGWIIIVAVPLAILNEVLLRWMAAELIESQSILRYVWNMAALVFVEAPLAGVFATAYLGKVTFHEQPTARQIIHEVASVAHRILWTLAMQRGVLLVIGIVYLMDHDDTISPTELVLIPFICFILFLWRSLRPYMGEIIVLERSPLRAPTDSITVSKRSARLHLRNSGDLFGRGIAMLPVTSSLAFAVWGSLWFFVGVFSNDWNLGPVMVHVVTPMVLWLLVVYTTVARFLSYLDLRIRTEGWEVELMMRAEGDRLSPTITFGSD